MSSSTPCPAAAGSQYPNFEDGDIVIVSSTGTRIWKLHSAILRRVSEKFNDIISNRVPRRLTKKLKDDGQTVLWKLQMYPDPTDLRFVDFQASEMTQKQPLQAPVQRRGMVEPEYHRYYDMFFRCIYNLDPEITKRETSGDRAIQECITILVISERLGSRFAIKNAIENHLLQLHDTLWDHVRISPETWCGLAVRLESSEIFREAIIHVAGRWNLPGAQRTAFDGMQSGEVITKIAQLKAEELLEKKLMVEHRLVTFFPPRMSHTANARQVPGRSTYATDIYKWQSLTIMRQYVAEKMTKNETHRAADGGTSFYRILGKGGDAWLNERTLSEYHNYFGMTTKGKSCFLHDLNTLKVDFQLIVKALLVDNLHPREIPLARPLVYLTCTHILDEEMPWMASRSVCSDGESEEDDSIDEDDQQSFGVNDIGFQPYGRRSEPDEDMGGPSEQRVSPSRIKQWSGTRKRGFNDTATPLPRIRSTNGHDGPEYEVKETYLSKNGLHYQKQLSSSSSTLGGLGTSATERGFESFEAPIKSGPRMRRSNTVGNFGAATDPRLANILNQEHHNTSFGEYTHQAPEASKNASSVRGSATPLDFHDEDGADGGYQVDYFNDDSVANRGNSLRMAAIPEEDEVSRDFDGSLNDLNPIHFDYTGFLSDYYSPEAFESAGILMGMANSGMQETAEVPERAEAFQHQVIDSNMSSCQQIASPAGQSASKSLGRTEEFHGARDVFTGDAMKIIDADPDMLEAAKTLVSIMQAGR